MSLFEYNSSYHMGANPAEELNLDEEVIRALVELVGSEEEVEEAAEASFNDLAEAFEKNEVEIDENSMPEHLALAALVLKLVEMGSLGPEEADSFIAEHLD
jgi:Asp-tRNA(Asn)/Glu-tRNA(Gln) amidotransferase B subunit